LISIIKWSDFSFKPGSLRRRPFKLLRILLDELCPLKLIQFIIDTFKNFRCHIFHTNQQGDRNTRAWEFLFKRPCPESICQIIMLKRALPLNGTKSAMMICENKSLGRNDFGCTTTSKLYNGIFQAVVVDAVKFISRKMKSHFLHIHVVESFEQQGQPHSFVRRGIGHDACIET
jgi:hypothetical protein